MPSPQTVPDVLLLAAEWQPRALLRAQLIEAGFEVRAVDTWPDLQQYLLSGEMPRLAIVDLRGLAQPDTVLAALARFGGVPPVIVLTASGSTSEERLDRPGFRVIRRPVQIGQVVAAASRAIRETKGPT